MVIKGLNVKYGKTQRIKDNLMTEITNVNLEWSNIYFLTIKGGKRDGGFKLGGIKNS